MLPEIVLEFSKAKKGAVKAGHRWLRRITNPTGGYTYVYKRPEGHKVSVSAKHTYDPATKMYTSHYRGFFAPKGAEPEIVSKKVTHKKKPGRKVVRGHVEAISLHVMNEHLSKNKQKGK